MSEFDDLLTLRATIERKTQTVDSMGGKTDTWTTRLSNVPCSLQPQMTSMVDQFGRRDFLVTNRMWTATDVACTNQDRVTVEGRVYNVIGYMPFDSGAIDLDNYETILVRRDG